MIFIKPASREQMHGLTRLQIQSYKSEPTGADPEQALCYPQHLIQFIVVIVVVRFIATTFAQG